MGAHGSLTDLLRERPYAIYVLFMMLLTYLLNQLDRYTLAIVPKESSHHSSSHSGDCGCPNGSSTGGWRYQLVAGPVFTLIYTFAGIPIGYFADRYNRRNILAGSLALWSLMTALMGLSQNYWQLVLARAGQGLGEAGCTPLANGIISDYFSPATRGTALGVYNWGIYTGYSMAYGLGNYLAQHIGGTWMFVIFGLAGAPVVFLLLTTVVEPQRGVFDRPDPGKGKHRMYSVSEVVMFFVNRPSLVLLCLAGAVRNAGGYVWAYNTNIFFQCHHDLCKADIAKYMSWIPLVGGSLGATFGGFIADKVIKNRGSYARVWVLVFSQILAAPFAAGALWLPVPWAFIALIPSNIIGEMWVGVTLAVVVELVTPGMRITAVAVYFFIISNIGGLAPLLVPPLRASFGLQGALLILFPGLYLLGALLFFLTLTCLRRDQRVAEEAAAKEKETRALLSAVDENSDDPTKVNGYQAVNVENVHSDPSE